MSEPKDIRRRLRDADPAAGAELDAPTRARMRAATVRTAKETATRRRPIGAWKAAAAVMVVALAALAGWLSFGPSRIERTVPVAERPTPPPAPRVATVAPPERIKRAVSTPASPAPPPPGPAADHDQTVTRIAFTAPGGTRILWFAGRSRAKEDRS